MPRIVTVEPADDTWVVRCGALRQTFLSGSKAEAAARLLGERFARSGEDVEVHIRLRTGEAAGRLVPSGLDDMRREAATFFWQFLPEPKPLAP